MVNDIIITLYGDRWLLAYCGDHFIMYINVKLKCSVPETNIILYVNYVSIKIFKKERKLPKHTNLKSPELRYLI